MKYLLLIFILCPNLGWAESLFVQSQKTALLSEAKMGSPEVGPVVRGDELVVVETSGNWYQVKKGTVTGWISKLFVSKNKPVGAATLAQEVTASEAKSSRRRESAYSVSASTRGLMPMQRSRSDRQSFQADHEALEWIQNRKVSDEEIADFIKNAEMGK
jgi:hypothetical protein